MELSATFLDSVTGPARAALEGEDELEAHLRAMVASARQSWPKIDLEPGAFLHYVAQRLPDSTMDALVALNTDDLYLACACGRGTTRALALFEERLLRPTVRATAGREDTDEELIQRLRVRLLMAQGESAPRIEQYAGRGSLKAWVRITVLRALKDQRRGLARQPKMAELADELLQEPGVAQDPELDEIRSQCGRQFREAFTAAVAGLPARERRLLRQHHLRGLTLDQLAAVHEVHRVTVARRLAKARQRLLESTRHELSERLAIAGGDFERMVALVMSRLELSVERLLATRDDL